MAQWIKGSYFTPKTFCEKQHKLIKSGLMKSTDMVMQGYKPEQNDSGILYHWDNMPIAYYDIPTLNDMIFSKKLWMETIHENPYVKASLASKAFYGEDCHRDNSEVFLENVVLRVNDWWADDNNGILASVDLLDTPKGLIVYSIAKSGMVGTSSRGFGDLYDRNTGHIVDSSHPQTGLVDVVEDAYLAVSQDAVCFPAVPSAFCMKVNTIPNPENTNTLSQSVMDLETGLREKITSAIMEAHEKDPMNEWIAAMFNSLNLADKQSKTFVLNENNVKSVFKKTYPSTAQIASAFKRGK